MRKAHAYMCPEELGILRPSFVRRSPVSHRLVPPARRPGLGLGAGRASPPSYLALGGVRYPIETPMMLTIPL